MLAKDCLHILVGSLPQLGASKRLHNVVAIPQQVYALHTACWLLQLPSWGRQQLCLVVTQVACLPLGKTTTQVGCSLHSETQLVAAAESSVLRRLHQLGHLLKHAASLPRLSLCGNLFVAAGWCRCTFYLDAGSMRPWAAHASGWCQLQHSSVPAASTAGTHHWRAHLAPRRFQLLNKTMVHACPGGVGHLVLCWGIDCMFHSLSHLQSQTSGPAVQTAPAMPT